MVNFNLCTYMSTFPICLSGTFLVRFAYNVNNTQHRVLPTIWEGYIIIVPIIRRRQPYVHEPKRRFCTAHHFVHDQDDDGNTSTYIRYSLESDYTQTVRLVT